MKIYYSSKKLEKILTNQRKIKKEYTFCSEKLIHRLSELTAANNLEEISTFPPPRRHKLSGKMGNCWGIDCSKNYRIIVEPTGEYNCNDLSTISEITIIKIEDYH